MYMCMYQQIYTYINFELHVYTMYIHKYMYMIAYLFHIVDNCYLYYTQRFTHEYILYKICKYYMHRHTNLIYMKL